MCTCEAVFQSLPLFLKRMERPMQEAIRTAHDAFGYTPEQFVCDLCTDTKGYSLPIGRMIDPTRDPYGQLDLRSCLKYLCCGGLRITGHDHGELEFAQDQDAFFVFFGVDMYYTAPTNALWNRRLCAGDVGRALMHLYRMLLMQEKNRESADPAQCLAWMITALQPLSDTQWAYQAECSQLQGELVAARFQALDAQVIYEQGTAYEHAYEDPRNICKAAECYGTAADMGYEPAQLALARCKLHGRGTNRDQQGALKILQTLAGWGYGPAIAELGECYYYGKGVPRDFERAEKHYLQAAEYGYPEALNTLGFVYLNGLRGKPQPEKAFGLYMRAAETGNPEGQFHVGRCWHRGEGVAQDMVEAIAWYRKAAKQGQPQAMYQLGCCAAQGAGVPQDMVEAERWFRKAAQGGMALARGMADAVAIGMLGKRDYTTEQLTNAVDWLQTLAEDGDTLVTELLGRIAKLTE